MKSLAFSSPSKGQHPDHQICNAKHSGSQIPNVEQIFDLGVSKVKDRVTLDGDLIESRVILGEGLIGSGVGISVGLTSNSSIAPIAEAPVTPLTERENGRRCSLTSLTPLTSVSCHSCSNNGDCCNEWSEKVEENPCSSVENTPEHSTFDPFASGPDELVFAPKKSFKAKSVFGIDNDNGNDGDVDNHDASKKPVSAKKHCKIRASNSVVRVLCFDEEDEIHGVGCNDHTGPRLDQHGSGNVDRNEQLQQAPSCCDSGRTESRSKVVQALDLDYDKLSTAEESSENCQLNGSDKLLLSHREDVLLEESFVETMCGSFLQAIISKHCEDANMDHNQGNNEDHLSHGLDQSAPATPVETKALGSVVDFCPGAPMKAKPKPRTRGAGFNSVCRKLEF